VEAYERNVEGEFGRGATAVAVNNRAEAEYIRELNNLRSRESIP